jgi:hypothetical protein
MLGISEGLAGINFIMIKYFVKREISQAEKIPEFPCVLGRQGFASLGTTVLERKIVTSKYCHS